MNNDQYRRDYLELVAPYAKNKPRITIDQRKLEAIDDLARKIAIAKSAEAHHKVDKFHELKRFTTGLLGEAALEQLLNVDIVDYSVGNSNIFNIADLSKLGLDIGIKTVEIWKFPIIHKLVKRPEIINILRDSNTIVCFGYATKEVLRNYQSDEYILSPNLKSRGTKTGFYGFSELITVNSLADVIDAYNKYDK